MPRKKTDNHNPAGKLELRRHFLREFHNEGPRLVLDCFQATGFLWSQLRTEFLVDEYLGLDIVPRRGRLKIDSARFLAAGGWPHNIVDLDAYGSPWEHWLALLRHCPRSVTVFLTIGLVKMGGGGGLSEVIREILGLRFAQKMPPSLGMGLHDTGTLAAIAQAREHGFTIVKCLEAPPGAHARYIGLRLERTP